MQKLKLYLDTSVISHLFAEDAAEKMADTWEFWEQLLAGKFIVCTSVVTQTEIEACVEPKRSQMIAALTTLPCEILHETKDVLMLAGKYTQFGVLGEKHWNDLLHISHAVLADCQCVVSWNFKHFVNVKTIDKINNVHSEWGLPQIKIVSPPMLVTGDDDAE